jgi:hypothetical protein
MIAELSKHMPVSFRFFSRILTTLHILVVDALIRTRWFGNLIRCLCTKYLMLCHCSQVQIISPQCLASYVTIYYRKKAARNTVAAPGPE